MAKGNSGGPFTEEEVEDVKTVLRLLPIVICLHLSLGYLSDTPMLNIFTENGSYADSLIGDGFEDWLHSSTTDSVLSTRDASVSFWL